MYLYNFNIIDTTSVFNPKKTTTCNGVTMKNDNEFNIHSILQDIDWWFSKTNNSEYLIL